MIFAVWKDRPAIVLDDKAFVVARIGDPWRMMDKNELLETAEILPLAAWHRRFAKFGQLDSNVYPFTPARGSPFSNSNTVWKFTNRWPGRAG
jgi:hypothetical protein